MDSTPKHLDTREVENYCPEHGRFRAEQVFIFGEWRGHTGCPYCETEGEQRRQAQERAKKAQAIIEGKLKRSGIPKRFVEKSFSGYRVKRENNGQGHAVKVCQGYANKFDSILNNGTCLVLCGKPGTGKTHLAASICNQIVRSGKYSALLTRVFSVIGMAKETYKRDSKATEQEALKVFTEVDLLVLDEVGVQFGSKYEQMILFEVINNRYDEMKPTILISNLAAGKIEDFIGERVMDRLMENNGVILPFDWKSERRVGHGC